MARVGGFVTDLPPGYAFAGEELTYDFTIGPDRFFGYVELRDGEVMTFTVERNPDAQQATPRELCERSYFGLVRLVAYAFGPPDTQVPILTALPAEVVVLTWTLRTGAQVTVRLDERTRPPPSARYCAIVAEYGG